MTRIRPTEPHTQALELQEKQLTQVLEMAEQEVKRNMDGLRRDVGGVVKDTQQRVEEAIWQLACASDTSAPPKHSHSAALDVVAAIAARAAQDAAGAAPPSSKSNGDAIKALRVRAWVGG